MSLRARILLGCLLLVAGTLFFVMRVIVNDIRPRYLESTEESMVDTAELLAALIAERSAAGEPNIDDLAATMTALAQRSFSAKIYYAEKRYVDLRVYVTDKRGILLYDSTGRSLPGEDRSLWRDVYLTLRGQYGARSTRDKRDNPATSVMYIAAPILKDGRLIGVVSVGKPNDTLVMFIAVAEKRLGLALALIGAAVAVLALLFSIWLTRPLHRLTAYVRSVRSVRESAPAPPPALGSSEIGVLGRAIADMQAELEGKNYIEDYVRALTHEMKSPLTGIKGAGEILREYVAAPDAQKFLDNIEADADRLRALAERMLQLSRLENIRSIAKVSIPAPALFQEIAASFRPGLENKGLRLETRVPPDLVLRGDALLLRQAVDNLIANAVDFSPPGTVITLSAETTPRGRRITVADQGPGMPDFALDKAFDKFFSLPRPGTEQKSTGLGLPFVKEVAALHGGNVRLAPQNPGLAVCLELPSE